MQNFTDAEISYLRTQDVIRFATASAKGSPDVAPVIFTCDGDRFEKKVVLLIR